MKKDIQYTVIFNPQRLINKHEVWRKGESEIDIEGTSHKVSVPFCGPVKAFRTTEAAEGYIEYQKAVREFKEGA